MADVEVPSRCAARVKERSWITRAKITTACTSTKACGWGFWCGGPGRSSRGWRGVVPESDRSNYLKAENVR
jgi:hypothetical protein